MSKLFQYAVLHHPAPTKDEADRGVTPPSVLVTDLTTTLANDDKEVAIRAARSIPEAYNDKLAEVEILVRPF